MNTVAKRAAYYRANPHRFCSDYLFPDTPKFLKTFQKILICSSANAKMHLDQLVESYKIILEKL